MPVLKTARTVNVIVEETYTNTKNVRMPFQRSLASVFKAAGLGVVTQKADLTIRLRVQGEAYALVYKMTGYSGAGSKDLGAKQQWVGAIYKGTLVFEVPGRSPISVPFQNRAPITTTIDRRYDTPDDAPFEGAFTDSRNESLLGKLMVVLCEGYGREAVEAVFRASKEEPARLAAVSAAARGGKEAVPFLMEVLRGGNTAAKLHVAPLLGATGDDRAVPVLEQEARGEAVVSAVRGLGFVGTRAAAEALARCLRIPNFAWTGEVIDALEKNPDPIATDTLIELLAHENQFHAAKAASVLAKRTGRSFGSNKTAWQEWWSKNRSVP